VKNTEGVKVSWGRMSGIICVVSAPTSHPPQSFTSIFGPVPLSYYPFLSSFPNTVTVDKYILFHSYVPIFGYFYFFIYQELYS
jgi:hypothetical protein